MKTTKIVAIVLGAVGFYAVIGIFMMSALMTYGAATGRMSPGWIVLYAAASFFATPLVVLLGFIPWVMDPGAAHRSRVEYRTGQPWGLDR